MIALLCPGQGSQKPGFMNSWLEIPEYKNNMEQLSDVIGLDLIMHGTVSDEGTIRDTAIAQPLIVAASIATANLLELFEVSAVAGHSVGEVAAGYVAGILSEADAMKLVQVRANAMAKAAKSSDTGMAAVLGGEVEVVLETLKNHNLTPANYNGAGQIVAAGSAEAIRELVANPPTGAKVIALSVAGAFHTSYMESAVSELADFANGINVSDPNKTIWSNHEAEEILSGEDYIEKLVGQVANSVRWDLCMGAMTKAGVTGVIELSPAGALAGLAKRGMPGVEIVALKEPTDLDAAREMIARG